MERSLRLRIVLESPPSGVDFGLQKGRGLRMKWYRNKHPMEKIFVLNAR